MEFLIASWLPIIASAVGVFVVSSIIHMAIPLHKGDTHAVPNEEAVGEAMRAGALKPGEYMIPYCGDMKEMGTDAYKAKLQRGPVAFLVVMPNGPMQMGRSLVQWFVYSLVIGILVAYAGYHAFEGSAPGFSTIFRVLGTVAALAYGISAIHNYIWRGQPGVICAKFVFEGVVYGLVTGAIFAWLW